MPFLQSALLIVQGKYEGAGCLHDWSFSSWGEGTRPRPRRFCHTAPYYSRRYDMRLPMGIGIFTFFAAPPHYLISCFAKHPVLSVVQGKYKEAGLLYKRATTIWEENSGRDHPNVANGLNNQARLLTRQVSSTRDF